MANRSFYNRVVIGKNGENYIEGMVEDGKRIFEKGDSPKKWGMICFAPPLDERDGAYDGGDNKSSYWNIGFVSDEHKELHTFPSIEGNFAWCTRPSPYWFCRKRTWMPYWGEATKQRAKLVREIRAFWAKKWCEETVPGIKTALLEKTPIPKDIIDFVLPDYFEYPYEIKNF